MAIAAVAERFGDVYMAGCLAGLWRGSLLQDLLWGMLRRPPVWRAPSWSWASVDGQVTLNDTISDVYPVVAEVVRCDVALYREELTFGAVSSGVLVLRAPLVRAEVSSLDEHPVSVALELFGDGSVGRAERSEEGRDRAVPSVRTLKQVSPVCGTGEGKPDCADEIDSEIGRAHV